MTSTKGDSLIAFFGKFQDAFPQPQTLSGNDSILTAIGSIQYFTNAEVTLTGMQSALEGGQWIQVLHHLKAAYNSIIDAIKEKPGYTQCDLVAIAKERDQAQIELLLSQIVLYAVSSSKKSEVLRTIKELPDKPKRDIALIIKAGTRAKQTQTPSPMNNQLAELCQENEMLKQRIRETQTNSTLEEQTIAELSSRTFALSISNDTKRQKVQQMEMLKQSVAQLEQQKLEKVEQLQKLISEAEVDPKVLLRQHLQTIQERGSFQTATELTNQKKRSVQLIKQMKSTRDSIRMRMDAKRETSILSERVMFMKQLVKETERKETRLSLSLSIYKRKLRCEAFQQEMRAFC